jgi:hypothetical protein
MQDNTIIFGGFNFTNAILFDKDYRSAKAQHYLRNVD